MPSEYRPHGVFDPELDLSRCKASVSNGGRSVSFHQCFSKPSKDGWCKIHHPDAENARQEAREKKWRVKQDAINVRVAQEAAARRLASRCVKACNGINPDAVPEMVRVLKDIAEMSHEPAALLARAALSLAKKE